MPNANYQKGRRFEYERLKHYREVMGHDVIRASGSHGNWDLVAIDAKHAIVTLIQCKVCSEMATAKRLLNQFREHPPLTPMKNIHQRMEVKVTGSTEVHGVTT